MLTGLTMAPVTRFESALARGGLGLKTVKIFTKKICKPYYRCHTQFAAHLGDSSLVSSVHRRAAFMDGSCLRHPSPCSLARPMESAPHPPLRPPRPWLPD
jgi:hypothetical protein